MKIFVPVQMVPDLVEELELNKDGNGFDLDYLAWILNEFDDHAIEQAVILKEKSDANVTVLAPDFDEIDNALFTAAAKGVDQLAKIPVEYEDGVNNHGLAKVFKPILEAGQPDVILTGVSNHNTLDGSLGPILAKMLNIPYVGYVSGVELAGSTAIVKKEYPGGLLGEYEVALPAVFGVQASEEPPRYVPVSKVRQAMKTAEISEEDEAEIDLAGGPEVSKMYPPEITEKAEMLEGDVDEIAEKLVEILQEKGLL